MSVQEYEGDDRVLFTCDRCGFYQWMDNPSTREMLRVQCRCCAAKRHAPKPTVAHVAGRPMAEVDARLADAKSPKSEKEQ